MRIGPTDRGGFTPFANAETERVFNELTPAQALLYIGLRIEAQFGESCERRDAFGRTVVLGPGEVLFGIDSAATRYGMKRDQVRRAIDRYVQLGMVVRREAVAPATAHAAGSATPGGRAAATPPTVLTFLTDREKCWRAAAPATPGGRAAATPRTRAAAPIQPATKNQEPSSSLRSSSARREQVDAPELPRKQLEVLDLTVGHPPLPKPEPGPFERVVAHWFRAWELAGRGKHSALTQVEGATLKRLVRQLGDGELVGRIDRAFADPWFLKHGHLMLFAKQRDRFARPGRPSAAAPAPASPAPAAEWAAVLAEHERLPPGEQRRGIRELDVQARDGALVLRARDGFDAARLRDTWASGLAKLAEKALGRRVAVLVDDPSRNLQVGSAAPAPAEAFVGGDRELAP